MDEYANAALERLRRRFGIGEPAKPETKGSQAQASHDAAPPPSRHRSIWPHDAHTDSAEALARRHGIDRRRYDSSPQYRGRVNAAYPAFAAALQRENPS